MFRVIREQTKLYISIELYINLQYYVINSKIIYRNNHILLESDHSGKNSAEADAKNKHFSLAKPSVIADCQSESHRLLLDCHSYFIPFHINRFISFWNL